MCNFIATESSNLTIELHRQANGDPWFGQRMKSGDWNGIQFFINWMLKVVQLADPEWSPAEIHISSKAMQHRFEAIEILGSTARLQQSCTVFLVPASMLSQPVSKGTVAGSDMDVDEANLWSSAPPGSYVASFREIIRSYAGDCCLNLPLLIDAFDNMAYDDVIICHFSGTVMRTIVDLPDKQIEALKQLGKSVHSSRAELVRRAIDEYLARHLPALDDDAFGLWEKRKTDGVIYQEHARDEWDK